MTLQNPFVGVSATWAVRAISFGLADQRGCPIKWFKHISDSLDDPFIFDLCRECGPTGYYVFFGVLEIYSREFKAENEFKLAVSWSYLCSKLVATRSQHIKKALLYCNEKGRFQVYMDGQNVEIYIPKFRKYLDEFTLKKLRAHEQKYGSTPELVRSKSGGTPKKIFLEEDEDKDKDKDNNPPTPQGVSVSVVKSYQYPEWLNKSLWADFVKMRNKKKKPILTEKTISNLIKALQKLISAGYEQDDIIQAAIDNVWQSFYPPKGQGGWGKEKEQPQSQHKIYKAGDKRYAD